MLVGSTGPFTGPAGVCVPGLVTVFEPPALEPVVFEPVVPVAGFCPGWVPS